MPEKRKKNNVSVENNPFLNDKLYPVTGIISLSFMDSYITNNYRPYEHILSSDQKNSDNINDKYTALNNIMTEAIKEFKNHADALNKNNLSGLKEVYKMFCDNFNKEYKNKTRSKKPDNNDIILTPFDNNKVDYIRKQKFIEAVFHYFLDPLQEMINTYNKYSYDSCLFLDIADIICIDKIKGIISKADTRLYDAEIELIKESSKSVFGFMEQDLKLKTDSIFLLYIHVLMGFKHRPFGLIITDTRKHSLLQGLDYYTSNEVRDMIDSNFMYEYFSTLNLSDDELDIHNQEYFGFDDDSDDDEDDF